MVSVLPESVSAKDADTDSDKAVMMYETNARATNSVSQSADRLALLRLGHQSKSLVHAPVLTAAHRQRRLEFATSTAPGRPMSGDR
ncbi:hypothetical protein TNCV_3721381 [Trichonephila clavipes]|nr:hypothetical protein TNCV_3721381 [Trichonephila clavipes]